MASIKFDISEVEALAKRLSQAGNKAQQAADKAANKAARRAAELARERVPVRTGRLRDSIRATDNVVEATAPYAAAVEYGTHRQSPQPYVGPAVDQATRELARDLSDVGKEAASE